MVVNLTGHTTRGNGLSIRSELDERSYPKGHKITKEQVENLPMKRDSFHGEWNYRMLPQ